MKAENNKSETSVLMTYIYIFKFLSSYLSIKKLTSNTTLHSHTTTLDLYITTIFPNNDGSHFPSPEAQESPSQ